jgi:GAF domain-containing protein
MNRADGSDAEHRTESLLTAQIHALERIAAGAPLREILAVLALAIEEQAGGEAIVSIFLVDAAGKRLRIGAAPSLPEDFNRAVDGIEIKPGLGTCADAAARAAVTITTDIAAAAGWKGLAHLPEGQGLKAAWSMPIMSSQGKVLGTIGTTSASDASRPRASARSSKCCAEPRASRSSGAQPRTPRGAAATAWSSWSVARKSASGTARCRSTS